MEFEREKTVVRRMMEIAVVAKPTRKQLQMLKDTQVSMSICEQKDFEEGSTYPIFFFSDILIPMNLGIGSRRTITS